MPTVAAPSYPDNTGLKFDFSSIEFDIDGVKYEGIAKISYSDDMEPGEQYGPWAQSLGDTRGQYKCEASIELPKPETRRLIAALADANGNGYAERKFTITVNYAESGQPTQTDQLLGCRVKKVGDDHAAGPDVLINTIDLRVGLIVRDGFCMMSKVKR